MQNYVTCLLGIGNFKNILSFYDLTFIANLMRFETGPPAQEGGGE